MAGMRRAWRAMEFGSEPCFIENNHELRTMLFKLRVKVKDLEASGPVRLDFSCEKGCQQQIFESHYSQRSSASSA